MSRLEVRVRGDLDQRDAILSEDTRHLVRDGHVLRNVLEHVRAEDGVEAVIVERKVSSIGLNLHVRTRLEIGCDVVHRRDC